MAALHVKATNKRVTKAFLSERVSRAVAAGYSKQKWVEFCEEMLDRGYNLRIYEARQTASKYITVYANGGKQGFKVRFSNHKPNKGKEMSADCDFFVGITHTGVRTTAQAIAAVDAHFTPAMVQP